MRLLKPRKADPISQRTQTLNAEIAALEVQIQQLGSQLQEPPTSPGGRRAAASRARARKKPEEPVFEPVDHQRVTTHDALTSTPEHFNDLGVRKYDLAAAWRRLQRCFQGPTSSNPKLINYLAAGSIKGLRPLRYEKRVARNRVIALTILLVVGLLGILTALYRH
jgi:hypothetical protein